MKNKKLFIKILTIVLAVVVLGGVAGSIYYYKIKTTKKLNTPATIEDKDITADWRLYKNIKYGYELKYPVSLFGSDMLTGELTPDNLYTLGENKDASNLDTFTIQIDNGPLFREGIMIRTEENKDRSSLQEWVNKNSGRFTGAIQSDIDFLGLKAIKVVVDQSVYPGGEPSYSEHISFLRNNTFFEIESTSTGKSDYDNNYRELFDKIISSIKLTDPIVQDLNEVKRNSVDVSDLKTYKNEELDFEFQYPPQYTFATTTKDWDEEKKQNEALSYYKGSRFTGGLSINDRNVFQLVFLSNDYKEGMGRGGGFGDYNSYTFNEQENKYYLGRWDNNKLEEITSPVRKVLIGGKEGIIIDYNEFLKGRDCGAGYPFPYLASLIKTGWDKYLFLNISFSDILVDPDPEKCIFNKPLPDDIAIKIIESFKFTK